MPLPYAGTLFLMWVLFVGSFSVALIHNDNLLSVKNVEESIELGLSSSGNKEATLSSLKSRSEVLHNTIYSSEIGGYYSNFLVSVPEVNSQTSAQNGTLVAGITDGKALTITKSVDTLTSQKDASRYELKTFVHGNGNIIYSSGVICGTICSVRYQKDSSITLTASSGPGMIFSGWSGACTGVKKCTVLMNAVKEVTATFSPATQSSVPVVVPTGGISEVDVTKHSTQSDCWIVVSGKVYSVSSYIAMHPGGRSAIITMCGKDATTGFSTRGGTGGHSSTAHTLLGGFLIGSLSVSIPTPTPTPTLTPTTSTTYTIEVTSAGNYNVTSLNLHVGDKIIISYVSPRTNEIKTSFTPSPPSSVTVDKENVSKMVTFTSVGTYTFKAQDHGGNTVIVVVE